MKFGRLMDMMKQIRIMGLISGILLFMALTEPGLNSWHLDYDQALDNSRKTGKPVMIYFSGSDWCKPCILLSKEALETPEFATFSEEHLILVKADFPRMKKNRLKKEQRLHNESLAERYNPDGQFPLLIILDEEEKVIYRSGYTQGGAEYYIKAITSVLSK